ncbi:N-acetylmuramoyl-L-alanine amidase [Roseivivax isoporae LMG 25204]|uniref:N-acetylmuramoyl-L-alanine amidase n=1 Tax=Roseivivax isoporae LMG 25204 TaxID=1449351 RepID=X7FBS2_9RHOB|nr:N-acetylmuramoyl-L-alanine amidase [Roseivivax isoporae LMG 25204]
MVIHYTAMKSAERARDWLCDGASGVSAHYVISETGCLWQLVDEEMRAWHAGAGRWGGIVDMNSRSIGIELANDGAEPFSEPQMDALERLLSGILERWRIAPERVIGHSDMALGRKIDPGPRFDWRRLARRGLSIWPEPRQPGDFFADAARFGYAADPDLREALLQAFRDRFRPGAAGPCGPADAALMADLAARWPAADQPTS